MGYLLRIIIFLILGWLAYRLVRRLTQSESVNDVSKPSKLDKEEMVPCDVCGLHVPQNEALNHDGKVYCSTAHLESDNQ